MFLFWKKNWCNKIREWEEKKTVRGTLNLAAGNWRSDLWKWGLNYNTEPIALHWCCIRCTCSHQRTAAPSAHIKGSLPVQRRASRSVLRDTHATPKERHTDTDYAAQHRDFNWTGPENSIQTIYNIPHHPQASRGCVPLANQGVWPDWLPLLSLLCQIDTWLFI